MALCRPTGNDHETALKYNAQGLRRGHLGFDLSDLRLEPDSGQAGGARAEKVMTLITQISATAMSIIYFKPHDFSF